VRNVRLWRALLGVDRRTVIEDIEFDQEAAGPRWWWRGCGHGAGFRAAVAVAAAGRRGMTAVRGGAAGGAWIGGLFRYFWRRMRRG
jgi:hypothetical protein